MSISNEILISLFIMYGVFVFFGILQIILDVITEADDFDSKED